MPDTPSNKGFLPDFCRIRMVFAWVITAELLAIVLTLASVPDDFWIGLSLRSMYIQWVALSYAAVLCLLRPFLNRLSHRVAGFSAWLLGLAVTLVVFFSARLALGEASGLAAHALLYHLAISAIMFAIVLRYLYEMFRQHERDLAEARARAQALQARIRPHFLFNSMNTIAGLTQIDADLATEVVHDLSDLFRASLSDNRQLSTLQQEFELAEGYLRIEAQRLGERLRVAWDLQELPMQALLPPLLLQPLLENAIYHGIEPSIQGGDIEVSGRFRKGVINLAISNTLPDQAAQRQGNRMAQENVRQRLQATFEEQADLRIGQVDGRYQVRVFFPLREEQP